MGYIKTRLNTKLPKSEIKIPLLFLFPKRRKKKSEIRNNAKLSVRLLLNSFRPPPSAFRLQKISYFLLLISNFCCIFAP